MQRSFSEELKYQWQHGGIHIKLIFINLFVFLFIKTLLVFGHLFVSPGEANLFENILNDVFTLRGTWHGFITHPWGILTSIFAHFSFLHLLFNMVFFYFISRFFLMYFSNQRMLYTYILGGIVGGIFQIFAYSVFPALKGNEILVVGASGAVNAVFMAAAFYRPMAEVHLFGIIKLRMIYIALIFFFMDLLQMGGADNVAHFAHLGGAVFGILSIRNIDSKFNIINWAQRIISNLKAQFRGKPKLKVKRGGKNNKNQKVSEQSDEQYREQKKARQEEIDAILDKISKSGYDSLSKREKQILFDRSQQ